MIHPVIERMSKHNQAFIRKKLRSLHEYRVMKYLEEVDFPAPRLLQIDEEEMVIQNGYIYMQDLGEQHLETKPTYFEAAFHLHKQITNLQFSTEEESITSATLLEWLELAPPISEICKRFNWAKERADVVFDVWERLKKVGPVGEPLIFSHGDYHPRNIMIYQGNPVPIDWEKAGLHSIYQDVYSLLDMCYPDAEACLTNAERERLYHLFSKESYFHSWKDGYPIFRTLYRLNELVFISNDLISGIRDTERLMEQAEYVFRDLRNPISY